MLADLAVQLDIYGNVYTIRSPRSKTLKRLSIIRSPDMIINLVQKFILCFFLESSCKQILVCLAIILLALL